MARPTAMADPEPAPATAVPAVLGAAIGFAACNVAWRYGSGSALSLAAQRAALGAVLVGPVLRRARRDGRLRAAATDPMAIAAVLASATTLVAAATMFRALSGPQAGLMVALTPCALVVLGDRSKRRRPSSLLALGASIAFGGAAAATGGLGHITTTQALAAGCFMAAEVASMALAERARQRHGATVLVASAMVVGAVGCGAAAAIVRPSGALAMSGVLAALTVAVIGTLARVLRHFALPHLGSAVTYGTAQITAVATALSGVALRHDPLAPGAAALGGLAAGAAVAAVVLGTRDAPPVWRPERSGS